MARRPFSHRESQIDPFNAGEPIMPWDDPDAEHVECDLDDGEAYDASRRLDDDGYDAPSTDRTEQRRRRAEQRAQEDARRTARQRATADGESAQASGDGSNGGPQAGEAPQKKRRGCIVKGIIVLVVIEILGSLISCAGDAVESLFDSGDASSGTIVAALSDDDDAACQAAVEDALDGLAQNDETRAVVIQEFEGLLEDKAGRSCADLGLDPEAFADWYFSVFWYEIDEAYAWDDETGDVYFSYLYFDWLAGWDFAYEVEDYLDEQGVDTTDELTAEQLEHVQALYQEFLDGCDLEEDSYTSLGTVCEDGEWAVDPESYTDVVTDEILDLF